MTGTIQQLLTPNVWTLSGGGILVRYYTNPPILPAPRLIYQDGQRTLSFSGAEIRSNDVPDLGTLVSVTIVPTVDAAFVTFSLLLPQVNLLQQGPITSATVSTEAIQTTHTGLLDPPLGHGQQEFYTVIALTGTASHALLP